MLKKIYYFIFAIALLFVGSAQAADMFAIPEVNGPLPVTEESHPFNGAAWQVKPIHLGYYGYEEKEYLIRGAANVYGWEPNGNYIPTVVGEGDYVTRILVRKPADMSHFSGVVVVGAINPSALYDWTAIWAALWERIVANGDIYIGITSKPAVFPGLKRFDKERYGELKFENPVPIEKQACGHLPGEEGYSPNLSKLHENGLIWDIFTQVGTMLRTKDNPLGFTADTVILAGESQTANYTITYYKYFTPRATIERNGKTIPVFNGYLLEAPTTPEGVPINQCAEPLPAGDPQHKIPGRSVPIMMINSQWDFFPAREHESKPDSWTPKNRSRTWELAGANHGWRWQYLYGDAQHKDLAKAGLLGDGEWSAWKCLPNRLEVPLYMAEKAMYEHLLAWIRYGVVPPRAEPIALKSGTFEIVQNENGIAKGGLRFPMVQVPINTYGGYSVLSPGCPELEPFSTEKIQSLYPTKRYYVKQFSTATWELVQQGYILPVDARKLIESAKEVPRSLWTTTNHEQ